MSVVTKKGDGGQTGLIGGVRISKRSERVDAIGSVDEVNSVIGLLKNSGLPQELVSELETVQAHFFVIGALLAAPAGSNKDSQGYIPRLRDEDVVFLEEKIARREPALSAQKKFILPGGVQSASICFWLRSVVRRAERAIVALAENEEINPLILRYLNRLSDYFFILARFLNKEGGASEPIWLGGTFPQSD